MQAKPASTTYTKTNVLASEINVSIAIMAVKVHKHHGSLHIKNLKRDETVPTAAFSKHNYSCYYQYIQ